MVTKVDFRYVAQRVVLLLLAINVSGHNRAQGQETPNIQRLTQNWQLQSSAQVNETGETISNSQYRTTGWYRTKIPSTVLAVLVDNKVYPDPYFGMNLRSIPGTSYPIGAKFANLPMPEDSPFRVSWWYRTEFRVPTRYRGKKVWLHFDGINYRANIWLNGHKIADSKDVAGTFRLYKFDASNLVKPGASNALAVEVFPPQPDDLALGWVDWNPTPADKNMGIWHDVYLTTSGPITLSHSHVVTDLDLPSLEIAHLTVSTELRNTSSRPITGELRGRIEDIQFSQTVSLAANETRTVDFTPAQFPQLNVSHPRLWWPTEMGPQNLYALNLEFHVNDKVSDRQRVQFGIRKITSELDKHNHRLFKINGRNILIRGGGWSPDMMLRYTPERLEQEFRYVKDMHLNTIRTEGKLESDYFYHLADRYGILIMAGWCCCDQWEFWEYRDNYKEGTTWDREDYLVAESSQEDQIRRLRNHPSLLVWMNGSDQVPSATVEKIYIDVLERNCWSNPYLSSAGKKISQLTGSSGTKMEGPYEWVPPSYWLLDKDRGGAFGFATEISPGPAVPPIESLHRMLPKEHLWPIDEHWSYHCGGGRFRKLDIFTKALNARYGTAKNVEDYAAKSQMMAYEGQRAMFEAYARNKYESTGVIQWMLNNAWPSMIWHLYDYYLRPGGGYFGTKKACEPVHIQYSYDDRSIVVVNGTYQNLDRMKVRAQVFDLKMMDKYSKQSEVSLLPDQVSRVFTLPTIDDVSSTYFVKLTLQNKDGVEISSNFYWLSTKDDVLDWPKGNWFYTPTSSYADFTALEKLQGVRLVSAGRVERKGDEDIAHVTIENRSRNLALAIRLQIKDGRDGDEILPILWEDNYIALIPGERRELTARYKTGDLAGKHPVLAVNGWNVESKSQPLQISQ